MRFIETLSLKYCKNLGDRCVEGLSKLKRLKDLDISGLQMLTMKGLNQIFQFKQLKSLGIKSLSCMKDDKMDQLTNLQYLEKLNVSGYSRLTYKVFQIIGKLTTLKELDISRNSRFGHFLGYSYLKELNGLEILRMKNIVINKKSREGLCNLLTHLTNLKELNLGFINANDKLCHIIGELTNLSKLTMNGVNKLKPKSFKCFKHLKYFDFSRSRLPPKAIRHLKSVQTLILDNSVLQNYTKLIDEGTPKERCIELRSLSFLYKLKNLKSLSLCSSDLQNKDIVDISKCTNLEKLDLLWCSSKIERSFHHLSSLKKLTYLNLTNCKYLSDKCLEIVFPNLQNLKELSLSRCLLITDRSLKLLASCCTKLKYLVLFNLTEITNVGVLLLYKLKDLEFLEISGCKSVNYKLCNAYLKRKLPHLRINGYNCDNSTEQGCTIC